MYSLAQADNPVAPPLPATQHQPLRSEQTAPAGSPRWRPAAGCPQTRSSCRRPRHRRRHRRRRPAGPSGWARHSRWWARGRQSCSTPPRSGASAPRHSAGRRTCHLEQAAARGLAEGRASSGAGAVVHSGAAGSRQAWTWPKGRHQGAWKMQEACLGHGWATGVVDSTAWWGGEQPGWRRCSGGWQRGLT